MKGEKIEPTAIRAHRMKVYKALIAFLPPRYGYGREVSTRLNRRGKKSGRGKEYTEYTVHSIVAQGTYDRHVEAGLVELAVEYTEQPIHLLIPGYKPTYELVAQPA